LTFLKYEDFSLPDGIPLENSVVKNIHEQVVGHCLDVKIPECYLKYYSLLCYYFLEEKFFDFSAVTAREGLEKSHNLYLSEYPHAKDSGYFDNPISEYGFEGSMIRYGGKAIEKSESLENAIHFYEGYLDRGHWIYGLTQAIERLVILYKRIKTPEKAIEILENSLRTLELPELEKLSFQERLAKLYKTNIILDPGIEIIEIEKSAKEVSPHKFPLSLSKIQYKTPELAVSQNLLKSNNIVFKTENTYWWSIQSLLYYEEIFADIPGQTFPGYKDINGMPLDFFDGRKFYERRRELFEKKNDSLIKANLLEEVDERFEFHKNENIRHLIIDHVTKEGLLKIAEVVEPRVIVLVCDRINSNVLAFRTGLPDLFVCDRKNNYQFIEVKKHGENIKLNQRLWLEFLSNIGVNTTVYRVKSR